MGEQKGQNSDTQIIKEDPGGGINRIHFQGGFWDDFLVDIFSSLFAEPHEEVNSNVEVGDTVSQELNNIETEGDEIRKEAENEKVKRRKTVNSKAIDEEINTIRYRYIVGKIAGELIVDSKGKTIVEKDDVITRKVVETAEKEGKLNELIVNMVYPGLK